MGTDVLFILDQSTILTFILVFLVCVLVQRLIKQRKQQHRRPPSPRGWLPIIGHFHLVEPDLRVPFRKFRAELGDIFTLNLGSKEVIVLNGYDVIHDALVKHGDYFLYRPKLLAIEKLTRSSGISNTSGQQWKELRRFTLSTLKNLGMGKSSLEAKIHEEITGLLDEIAGKHSQPFDPRDYLHVSTANIISSMVFGATFQHGDQMMHDLEKIFQENTKYSGMAGVVNFLPFLAHLPGDLFKYKRVLTNTDTMFGYIEEILNRLRRTCEKENIVNFTTTFFGEMDKIENMDSLAFNMQQLPSLLLDLFITGSETLTSSLRWALAILATRPDIQTKLFTEVTSVTGNSRLPTIEDRPRMPYTEAFYMEVLRYCNVASVGLPRTVNEDVVFHNYLITKDTLILVNYDSVLMDPDIWNDPHQITPERFLDQNGKLKKVDQFLPFSSGKRNCVGESLAKTELCLFIGSLVQRFKFETPPGADLSLDSLDGEHGFIHSPKSYEIIARPR